MQFFSYLKKYDCWCCSSDPGGGGGGQWLGVLTWGTNVWLRITWGDPRTEQIYYNYPNAKVKKTKSKAKL